jgi:hypothetical protein
MEVSVNDVQLSLNLSKTLRKLKSLGYDKAGWHSLTNTYVSANGLSLSDLEEALKSGLAQIVDSNGIVIRPLTNIIKSIVVDSTTGEISFELLLDITD